MNRPWGTRDDGPEEAEEIEIAAAWVRYRERERLAVRVIVWTAVLAGFIISVAVVVAIW